MARPSVLAMLMQYGGIQMPGDRMGSAGHHEPAQATMCCVMVEVMGGHHGRKPCPKVLFQPQRSVQCFEEESHAQAGGTAQKLVTHRVPYAVQVMFCAQCQPR